MLQQTLLKQANILSPFGKRRQNNWFFFVRVCVCTKLIWKEGRLFGDRYWNLWNEMGKLSSTFSVFVWVHVFERIPTSPKRVACIFPMSVVVRDMVYGNLGSSWVRGHDGWGVLDRSTFTRTRKRSDILDNSQLLRCDLFFSHRKCYRYFKQRMKNNDSVAHQILGVNHCRNSTKMQRGVTWCISVTYWTGA